MAPRVRPQRKLENILQGACIGGDKAYGNLCAPTAHPPPSHRHTGLFLAGYHVLFPSFREGRTRAASLPERREPKSRESRVEKKKQSKAISESRHSLCRTCSTKE